MTKLRVKKVLFISLIGFILTVAAGIRGDIVLKAGSPATTSETDVNYEKRLRSLDADLQSGKLTKPEYDSLYLHLHDQMKRQEALQSDVNHPDKMPEWVRNLGVIEPSEMKFERVFSEFTSVENPSEGFNSVTLVYSGDYDIAINAAALIADSCHLHPGRNFIAKGSPFNNNGTIAKIPVNYLNYSLGHADMDYLISVQVEPSGLLTIAVTDNKQLTARLLTYEPLNNRVSHLSKQKKM